MRPTNPQLRSRTRRVARGAADALIGAAARFVRRDAAPDRTARPRRITVLALWGIGDALLLVPLLRALRAEHPTSEIELVGPPFLAALFAHEPAVDRVTVCTPPWTAARGKYRLWRRGYRELVGWLLRREASDWVITTRGDLREHVLAACMPAQRRFGYAAGGGAALLSDPFPGAHPLTRDVHRVEISREIAALLGCRRAASAPRIVLTQDERRAAREARTRLGLAGRRPLLGVHVGASFDIRAWPVERFTAALTSLREDVGGIVLLADPQGRWKPVQLPTGVPHAVVHGDLREVFAWLAEVDVLLCNDSGIMHAAAALGTPVVAPFGPTSPVWFRPFGPGHSVVRSEHFDCGPCMDHCRLGTPRCITAVDAPTVGAALRRRLAAVARHPVSMPPSLLSCGLGADPLGGDGLARTPRPPESRNP